VLQEKDKSNLSKRAPRGKKGKENVKEGQNKMCSSVHPRKRRIRRTKIGGGGSGELCEESTGGECMDSCGHKWQNETKGCGKRIPGVGGYIDLAEKGRSQPENNGGRVEVRVDKNIFPLTT